MVGKAAKATQIFDILRLVNIFRVAVGNFS